MDVDGNRRRVREAGGFHTIERSWRGETTFLLSLAMTPRRILRPGNAAGTCRGPLLYALRVGEEWRRINEEKPFRELLHGNWEMYPTTLWNDALELDERTLDEDIPFAELPNGRMQVTGIHRAD